MALADPPRILIVADGEESGRAVAALLAGDLAGELRMCLRPDQAATHAQMHRAEVIVLALPSLVQVEHDAPALRDAVAATSAAPFVIALCESASVGAAARLCRQGAIDDYVQHFPAPADKDRLASSVRLAARVVAASRTGPAGRSDAIAEPLPARRPVVVVVEDDEVLHTLVASMLASEHVELVFEADGAAAFDRIQAIGPDLVLMDIVLPGADGVAITEQIKATPELAAIPVVMLTGEARVETLVRSMQAGAADFIVKPFTREALVAKLGKYFPAVS